MNEQLETINESLDGATLIPFPNWDAAWTAIAQVLEDNLVSVPEPPAAEDELLYQLNLEGVESPHYLYITMDEEEGQLGVYATICDQADLDVLTALDHAEDEQAEEKPVDPPEQFGNTAIEIWNGWHHLRTRKAD